MCIRDGLIFGIAKKDRRDLSEDSTQFEAPRIGAHELELQENPKHSLLDVSQRLLHSSKDVDSSVKGAPTLRFPRI